MIYKTIITDADIKCLNDAHKAVHRAMHNPDEHKPCPPFMVLGEGMILVQSDYKPRSKDVIVSEVAVDESDTVKLRVRVAAVKRDPQTKREKPVMVNGKVDIAFIKEWIVRRFGEFGLTPVGNGPFVRYCGRVGEAHHGMKNCPMVDIDGVWKCGDKELLEKLLISKIGRRNFLGLGMVRLVNN